LKLGKIEPWVWSIPSPESCLKLPPPFLAAIAAILLYFWTLLPRIPSSILFDISIFCIRPFEFHVHVDICKSAIGEASETRLAGLEWSSVQVESPGIRVEWTVVVTLVSGLSLGNDGKLAGA